MIDNREALFFKPVRGRLRVPGAQSVGVRARQVFPGQRGAEGATAGHPDGAQSVSGSDDVPGFVPDHVRRLGRRDRFPCRRGRTGRRPLRPMVALVVAFDICRGFCYCLLRPRCWCNASCSMLTPTDQRITAADRRAARGESGLGAGPAHDRGQPRDPVGDVFLQAMQRAHGNPVSNAAITSRTSARLFAGGCFAFSSICMLIPALKK